MDSHERIGKLVFTGDIILAALVFVRDLAVPGRRVRLPTAVVFSPFALMLAFAMHEVTFHSSAGPLHISHTSWLSCLGHIAALAVPAFAILTLAVRRLAPSVFERPGSMSGSRRAACGALGYALHGRETDIAFSLVAYTSAILLMAFLGA